VSVSQTREAHGLVVTVIFSDARTHIFDASLFPRSIRMPLLHQCGMGFGGEREERG
jgi:hypothetical protein